MDRNVAKRDQKGYAPLSVRYGIVFKMLQLATCEQVLSHEKS